MAEEEIFEDEMVFFVFLIIIVYGIAGALFNEYKVNVYGYRLLKFLISLNTSTNLASQFS